MLSVELGMNHMGKELLEKFKSKQITEAEFDLEIAYMMMTAGIQHMRRRIDPPTPNDVLEYQRKKEYNPTFTVSQEFWKQTDVSHWTQACAHNRSENSGNWHWLKWLKNNIPQGDGPKQTIIDDVMKSYRAPSSTAWKKEWAD